MKFLLPLCLASFVSATDFKFPHLNVQLVSESQTVSSSGEALVGFYFELEPTWHVYWRNPGDSGEAVKVNWVLPKNAKAQPILWPTPKRIAIPPLANYGYEHEVLLPVRLTGLTGQNQIVAKLSWLVCRREECIPGKTVLNMQLSVSGSPKPTQWKKIFEKYLKAMPVIDNSWVAKAQILKQNIILNVTGPKRVISATFFPYDENALQNGPEQTFELKPNGFSLTLARGDLFDPVKTRLNGVLSINTDSRTVDIDISPSVSIATSAGSFVTALILAFLGGLILNIMPCVFPILTVKVLALTKLSGLDQKKIRREHLVYSGGVLISFWILAGLLSLFRFAGLELGWGFQLQWPPFVFMLMLLMFLMGLNLLGVFEIGSTWMGIGQTYTQETGYKASFVAGVLAVVVATPCTAPFMGAALGFALTANGFLSFGVFTLLGLGFAGPFLLLAYQPHWQRFLPKPGAWMLTFKKWMSLPMFLTALWLGSVFLSQIGGPSKKSTMWQKFSRQAVEKSLAQGKSVFIDFTAAWCITCQVNEKIALDTIEVQSKFMQKNVVLFLADWTNRDAEITEELARYGRQGVPLYVLQKSSQSAAQLWPQLLTQGLVLARLDQL